MRPATSIIAALAVGAVTLVAVWYWDGSRKPDWWAMRRYAISKMTDQEIRDAYAGAKLDLEKWRLRKAKDEAEAARRHARECSRFSGDAAYRERYPIVGFACGGRGVPGPGEHLSLQFFYEQRIMGVCAWVWTRRAAYRYGCLPGSSWLSWGNWADRAASQSAAAPSQ